MADVEQEARAEAVREAARYLDRLHRRGLVSLAVILADLEAVAYRMEQGMNARGNLRASRPAEDDTDWEYRYAETLSGELYTYGTRLEQSFATFEEADAARVEESDFVVRRRRAGEWEPVPENTGSGS